MDVILVIPQLIEEAVTGLVTPEGHDGVNRADIRLYTTSQGLVNKTLNKELNTVEFGDHLHRSIEEATPSHCQVEKVTYAMLEDADFIAPGERITMKESKRAVNDGLKGEHHR